MKKTLAVTLALVLVLMLVPATAFAAGDETLTVGAGGTYATIQDAIDAIGTDAGTKTIRIVAGTYDETVQILQQENIDIVLQGEAGTVFTGNMIIDGDGRGTGTDSVTIRNIAFDKSGTTLSSHVYIIDLKKFISPTYSYTHNVTIEDCSFVGDASGEYTFAIQAGSSSGNTAYNTVIRNCTFTQLDCMVQARCQGLTLENVTGTDVNAGVNSNNSSNITMTNVSIDAVEYVLRVGENGGTAANGFIHISGCEFICGSTLANEGAIVLRYSTTADITITSSDILGNVVNLSSNAITLTTDDVYWGMGCDITGFTNEQLDIQNDASVPHLFPTSGETEVTAGVDPTYTIIIPATLDFGTLTKNSGTATVTFDVTASGLVLELGSRVNVTVSGDFTMSDSGADLPYSLYNTTSSETALVDGGQFASFTADGTQNGRAEVNTGVIVNAGEYQDTMVFTITYVD